VFYENITRPLFEKLARELTTAAREHIKKKNFAIPERPKGEGGSYPIEDIAHGRNALARVHQHGTPEEIARVESKVYAKYPALRAHKAQKEGVDPFRG
jgi:hypothetical protein